MRSLAMLIVAVAIGFGVYHLYLKQLPVSEAGTAPTQSITIAGVKGDLLQIAQAERAEIASNSRCSTIDELISSGALAMKRHERDGYRYTATCTGQEFQITAEHDPAPSGSSIRYPIFQIDSLMQVREVNPN